MKKKGFELLSREASVQFISPKEYKDLSKKPTTRFALLEVEEDGVTFEFEAIRQDNKFLVARRVR